MKFSYQTTMVGHVAQNASKTILLLGLSGLQVGCVTAADMGYRVSAEPVYETAPVYNTSPAYYATPSPSYSTMMAYDGYHPGYGGPRYANHRPPPSAYGRDDYGHGGHEGRGTRGGNGGPPAHTDHAMRSGTSAERPAMRSGTSAERPAMRSGTSAERPTMRSGTSSERPAVRSGTSAERPPAPSKPASGTRIFSGDTKRTPANQTKSPSRKLVPSKTSSDKGGSKWKHMAPAKKSKK